MLALRFIKRIHQSYFLVGYGWLRAKQRQKHRRKPKDNKRENNSKKPLEIIFPRRRAS